MAVDFESNVLERMIEPQAAGLPPALARYFLSLDFSLSDHERMDELARKAQEGALTPNEESQLDGYLHLGHLLALLQSKARISLKNSGGCS